MGLDRVRAVLGRLGLQPPAGRVITVGGTNGKGSTITLLHDVLRAAGGNPGLYTSPHLVHYNERIRIGDRPVADAALIRAFERVEAARGGGSPDVLRVRHAGRPRLFCRGGLRHLAARSGPRRPARRGECAGCGCCRDHHHRPRPPGVAGRFHRVDRRREGRHPPGRVAGVLRRRAGAGRHPSRGPPKSAPTCACLGRDFGFARDATGGWTWSWPGSGGVQRIDGLLAPSTLDAGAVQECDGGPGGAVAADTAGAD